MGLIILLFLFVPSLAEFANLKCIPGVERFSAKTSPSHFYQCNPAQDDVPILLKCPQGQRYLRKMQKCVDDNDIRVQDRLTEKSLGRNIQLGSFYNARTGMFSPESSLWSRKTVRNATESKSKEAMAVTYSTDTLTKQKMEHMGISASLTLKFMGGFITLHGHFGYIVDKVSKDEQVAVQMKYDTTKTLKTIPKATPIDYTDQCDDPYVTHVVSSVSYGMGAVFNFQRKLQEGEDRSAIEAGLSTTIMIIPGISIGGGVDVQFNETIINILNSTKIQMFGDFFLEEGQLLPTTFNESVKFFQMLPSFSGSEEDEWAGTTIVDVTMTPIQEYCPNSPNVVEDITGSLMENLNNMFDELDQLEVENGALLTRQPAVLFQPIRQNLNLYKNGLQTYRLNVQEKVQDLLPDILGDPDAGEEKLIELYINHTNSQFELHTSDDFLERRTREINAVQILMERFPDESNIAIADYEMANDVEYIFKKEMVVVLEFYILTPKSLTQGFLNGNPVDESNFWFNDMSWIGHIGELLRDFSEFALANVNQENKGYLVKLSLVNMTNPETIYQMSALVEGQLISQNFVVPPKLYTPLPFSIAHDRFKFNVTKGNKFVTGCIVSITDNIGVQISDPVLPLNNSLPIETIHREIVHMFPEDLADDEDVEIVVYDLSPGRAYSFKVAYLTDVGTSKACEQSEGFWTAPVSAPTLLSVDKVSSDTIQISWQPPDIIAEYLHINKSLISYNINIHGSNYATNDLKYTFPNLDPGTKYDVQIKAFISKTITNGTELPAGVPSTLTVYTVPLAPHNFQAGEIGEHFVELSWDSLSNGADVLYYIIEYATTAGGSWSHVVKDTQCKITNLSRGSSYRFIVKVATLGGHSEPSAELVVDTLFIKTEFEEIKEQWEQLNDLVYDARAMSSFCSFKSSTNEERITYEKNFLDNNNVNSASMDISSGTFTAGAAASYQVSANMEMRLTGGQTHDVWVVVNDVDIEESRMTSSYDTNMPGELVDNGNKNIILSLSAGDRVYLAHQTHGDKPLTSVTFCISLIKIE